MPTHDPKLIIESGALTVSDNAWKEARRRSSIIGPLADLDIVSTAMAAEAGQKLGLSERTVYTLIYRFRESGKSLISLAPIRSHGGRGGKRLPDKIEKIISSTISEMYLTRQRFNVETVIKEISHRCRMEKIKRPGATTVRARIRCLRPEIVIKAREGTKAAHKLQSAAGKTPIVTTPLEVIQIDHTPVDVIVVDSSLREPIGRPWITMGIDVFSRCITGYCLTLEPPSAVSVGLCLVHSASDKLSWLKQLNVEAEWPVYGKPNHIFVDNGKEFHSEALRRGCEVHGIKISYRPVGASHYGGIVERVIGTFMQMVHTLPGTTFSNVAERGSYDSEYKSALTLEELQRWFALAITGPYHGSIHNGINEPPITRWKRGVFNKEKPTPVVNSKAFLVDFLPIVRRQIQRQGFLIDHIYYFSNALKPWIAERKQGVKFLIRRDPLDLSRIWVLNSKNNCYFEVPYRILSNPSITLWEHRQAINRIREAGRAQVDEQLIFRAIAEMRDITKKAVKKSKKARRDVAKRAHLENHLQPDIKVEPAKKNIPLSPAKPFSDIEEW